MKKIAWLSFYFIFALILFSSVSSAYIDPSSMTYLIEIVAGAVLTIGATAGFYWKRIKKNAKEKQFLMKKDAEEKSTVFENEVNENMDLVWEDDKAEK